MKICMKLCAFQNSYEGFRSSQFTCQSLEPGGNVKINITGVHSYSSDWGFKYVDIFFNYCDLTLLNICTLGTPFGTGSHMHISNCQIGSHIVIENAKATLENCSSFPNRISDSAAFIKSMNSTVVLKSSHIQKFKGGRFLQSTKGSFHLGDVQVSNCASGDVLFLASNESYIHIENCTFVSNNNSLVDIQGNSTGFIKNSSFLFNKMENRTGTFAILSSFVNCMLLIRNSIFLNNTVTLDTATVVVEYNSVGIIWNSTFNKNQGRSIFVYNSVGLISNCQFQQNTAMSGGALGILSDRQAERNKISVEKIVSIVPNDGVTKTFLPEEQSAFKQRLEVHNCTFHENTAKNGGAIRVENASLFLRNSTFEWNSAIGSIADGMGFGGAICGGKMQAVVTGCVFHENRAKCGGGAFYTNGRSAIIQSSSFTKNRVLGKEFAGGAIQMFKDMFPTHGEGALLIGDSLFKENSGGAVFADLHTTIKWSVFHSNHARRGGALTVPSADIAQCSFDSNTATVYGGALFLIHDSNSNVYSTNFTNNTAAGGGAVYAAGIVSFSCIFCSFYNNTATVYPGGSLR